MMGGKNEMGGMWQNVLFGRKYSCDMRFYMFLCQCLLRARLPLPPLEISVKTYTNGRVVRGRYTTPVALSHFLSLPAAIQDALVQRLGFLPADVRVKYLPPADTSTDIIFGQDGPTGKIYLDYLDRSYDPHMLCLESTGRIKYYRMRPGSRNWLDVTDAAGDRIGVHIRINGANGVYWYGIAADYTSEYIRP
jgi:hypothetical protein